MSNSTDSSAINDKKNKDSVKTQPDPVGFTFAYASHVINLCIIIAIGCKVLISCKVAQANILPSDIKLVPFTDTMPSFTPPPININVVNDAGNYLSTKIKYPLTNLSSFNKGILGRLKNLHDDPNAGRIGNYFSAIFSAIVANNYSAMNVVYNMMNANMYETFIIIFGPMIAGFLYMFLFFFNFLYLYYLLLIKIPKLFEYNSNTNANGKACWGKPSFMNMTSWFILFGMFLLSPIIFIGSSAVALMLLVYCAFTPLFMNAEIVGTNKKFTFINELQNIFLYKSNIIMIILSLYLILDASSYLGQYYGVAALIACLLCYFIIPKLYGQYVPPVENGVTPDLASYDKAEAVGSGQSGGQVGGGRKKKV